MASSSSSLSSTSSSAGQVDPDLQLDVFDLLKDIRDPEREESLSDLNVLSEDSITVTRIDGDSYLSVDVVFTPTVPHCNLATLIGLCIRTKLLRDFGERFKLRIRLKEDSHNIEHEINKQINDKERVAAALENESLRKMVDDCINGD